MRFKDKFWRLIRGWLPRYPKKTRSLTHLARERGNRKITGEFLGYPVSRLGYPVVPLRLYFGLFFTLPFFLFLAVMAHIKFGWFTPLRQLYFILGTAAGISGGYAEALFVTRRLKREGEVIAWLLIPLGLAIWLLPTAYLYSSLGTDEFLPFCTYFLLPSIAIAAATGGFQFHRFEKREKVQVFTFFLTRYVPYPKYWIETPETLENEFYGFLEAVADKSTSWMLYYGKYAERLKKHVEKLSERSDGVGKKVSEVKELTARLLDENIRFYRKGRRTTWIFMAGCVLWLVLMFFAAAKNYFDIPQKYGKLVYLITFGAPFLLIFAYPFIRRRALTAEYKKAVQAALDKVDAEAINEVLRLMPSEEE